MSATNPGLIGRSAFFGLLITTAVASNAAVLLQENFDGSLGQFTSVGTVSVTTSGARMAGSFGGTDGAITSPAVSTVGFTGLSLSYTRTTTGLDYGEAGILEYSTDGTTYTSLGSTQSASGSTTVALPTATENQAALRLRWRVNASLSTEYHTVDTILLQGTGGGGCEPNCPPIPGTPSPVRLNTDSGVLVGTSENGVNSFKGVPYAQPPVGQLRWKPPQRISWTGERDATKFGPACPQAVNSSGAPNGGGYAGPVNEDCLFLNVWAPVGAQNAPVMLFLHGGAGYLGAGSLSTYDGTSLAKQGVILVTINYRLGMLGQFAHAALTRAAASTGEPVGNYQLMDAIAALEWVQRNGAALGANTQNVTLFGQSAGAVLVGGMVGSPPTRGLFHKGIIQSGTPLMGGGRTLATAEQDGAAFATALGLNGANATVEQLRALPVDRVISSSARTGFSGGNYLITDGKIRLTTTGEAFNNGTALDVLLNAGSNGGEPSNPPFAAQATQIVRAASNYGTATAYQYRFDYVRSGQTSAGHSAELPFVFDSLLKSPNASGVTDRDLAVARRVSSCWVALAKAPLTATSVSCADGFNWPARTDANPVMAIFGETPSTTRIQ